MARFLIIAGCFLGGLSVAFGAFGAHMLRSRLDAGALDVFQTGVQYQGYHALALLLVGTWQYLRPNTRLKWAGTLFTTGILIFSGSLYALSLTGVKWFGAITPIGGICFLSGWVILTWEAARLPANPRS
jgi:uncharacterized membrane protein YgdD (TMEM256/DUF423 family)